MTQTQMSKGLARAVARLEESTLDCPHAKDILGSIMAYGQTHKWLEREST